jgi:hypothetical protein
MKEYRSMLLAAMCACGTGATQGLASSGALSTAATADGGTLADGGTDCASRTPSSEDIAACAGKTEGDVCTDVDGGDPGTCGLASDGITLACVESHDGGGRHR